MVSGYQRVRLSIHRTFLLLPYLKIEWLKVCRIYMELRDELSRFLELIQPGSRLCQGQS